MNLLSSRARDSIYPSHISREIGLFATGLVTIFIVVVIVAGIGNFYIDTQTIQAKNSEKALIDRITGIAKIDALEQILSSRVATLVQISQKRLELKKYLGVIGMIAPWSTMSAFSIQENKEITLRFTPLDIPDAVTLSASLLKLSLSSSLTDAHFTQIGLDSNGKVLLQLSFLP